MTATSIAVSSGQMKAWKRFLNPNSSASKLSVEQHTVISKVSEILPSHAKFKDANVIKHKDQQNISSRKSSFSGIRKKNDNPTTRIHSSECDQRKIVDKNDGISKITQKVVDLEDQIRAMKKEHVIMLESLYGEIESLKTKNKDLQFQLVIKDFDTNLEIIEEDKVCKEVDNPAITIITAKRDTAEVEELMSQIIELESKIAAEKSKNLNLSSLLEEEKSKLVELEERLIGKNESVQISSTNFVLDSPVEEFERPGSLTPTNNSAIKHTEQDIYSLQLDSEKKENGSNNILEDVKAIGGSQKDTNEQLDEFEDMSIPDTMGSSMSTPTPPDEYVMKLQEAEVMIEKLKYENRNHRKELSQIRSSIQRDPNLKFRGCNHPYQKKIQADSTITPPPKSFSDSVCSLEKRRQKSENLTREGAILSDKFNISKSSKNMYDSRSSSPSRRSKMRNTNSLYKSTGSKGAIPNEGKVITDIFRVGSLESFPPLTKQYTQKRHHRSPMRSGLPPVPGSSGSESTIQQSLAKPLSFNLVTLKTNEANGKKLSREKSYEEIYKTQSRISKNNHNRSSSKNDSLQRIPAINQLKQLNNKDYPS